MNALTNSMQKTVFQAGRRFASNASHTRPKAPFVPVRAAVVYLQNDRSLRGTFVEPSQTTHPPTARSLNLR
jgi:hypothetical protein